MSVDRASPVSTLSLFVKAGSRFETRSSTGATHFLKYFAGQVCLIFLSYTITTTYFDYCTNNNRIMLKRPD